MSVYDRCPACPCPFSTLVLTCTTTCFYCLQEIETWSKLANSMRDHVFWCHTTDKAVIKALGVKSDSITMIHEGGDYEEKAVVYSGDAKDMDKLKEFVAFNRTPVALLIKKGDQVAHS
jgi:hypothetical protein